MLENTFLFALLAIISVVLLVWRIKPDEFRKLTWWRFCIAAAIFWGSLSLILVLSAWDHFYSHFTPNYYRYVAPLAALFIYPLWSLVLRWIALRLPVHPILGFCMLGGIQGILEHAVAINRLNLLTVPFLAGSGPLAVYVLALFEYIVYWGIVVFLAIVVGRIQDRFWGVSETNPVPSTQ